MNRIFKVFPISLIVLGIGCSDQTTVYQDELQDDLFLEQNAAALSGAVSYDQAGVVSLFEDQLQSGKAADMAGDYPLTVVASIEPPSYQSGDNLTASHVDLEGDYAVVSYNTVGELYSGAIDVIDISDPPNPTVTARLFYINADINSLQISNGYIYAVGGVDSETSVSATSNSFLAKLPISGGKINTSSIEYGFQQGFNATDVLVLPDRILVSSGKDGSITAYNHEDLSIIEETYMADVRSMALTPEGLAALDAGSGVRLLDANLTETGLVPIGTDLGLAAKKTLDVRGNTIRVAEADKGAGIYEISSGELLEYLPIPIHPDGVDQADVVTNAVSGNDEAFFMANGGAGLCLSEEGANGMELVGILEIDGSVNYVMSQGDYAFAASGEAGLQIIRLNRSSESLESQCSDLPPYEGPNKLTVDEGETEQYSGDRRLREINVDGALLICGSWTSRDKVEIDKGGTLQLFGKLAVGRFAKRKDIRVKKGCTLIIEGDVTLYGDLILEDGSSLQFLGADSSMDIFGDVETSGTVAISGTFRDVRNKF
jgi:hypothetical protein